MNTGGYFDPNKLSQEDIKYKESCHMCKKSFDAIIKIDKPISNIERLNIITSNHATWLCNDCIKQFEEAQKLIHNENL